MSEKPRVAILSYYFWRHYRAVKIAETLARHGYRVKVWGTRAPVKKGPRILRGALNYLFAFFEVLFMGGADIYWVENVPDVIYLALPLLRRRYIYDRRSPWAKQIPLELRVPHVLLQAIESIEYYMASHAEHVIVVSTPMKYEYDYKVPVTVIPNYPEKGFVKKVDRKVRDELGIDPATKIFGFVGALSRIEGADLLAGAAEKLSETEGVELWIMGDGPLAPLAEQLDRKYSHVRWFGWVDRSELPRYLASLDYGLVPRHRHPYRIFYTHEGIHKIGEYFAYGKPVIASGIAPSPYYLSVEPEEFADTLVKVARGEVTPPQPPRNLFWEEVSEPRVLSVIEEVLREKRRR